MSLSSQLLDEVRARTSLSLLVARKVRLTKAGHEFKACCPFHNEKSPSFTVSDDKGFYHCFGCGAHGDAIRWLQEQEGLEFLDAVRQLADAAGLAMPEPARGQRQQDRQQSGLHDVMAAAQKWFTECLSSSEGAKARAYLATRGFDAHTVQRFGFGYAPEGRQALKAALAPFPEAKLIEAGLRIAVDDKEPYDRFRGRLMLPIEDARGRVIAFGGRILDKNKTDAPKYLNSPDTPLFDKGRTLYNLHRAGPLARKADRLIVVEGYLDAIALDQAGLPETVASSGTALTEAQMALLWRVSPEPLLCFDGDAAGRRASAKAAIRALAALEPGKTFRFVTLPSGQDPDDVVRVGGKAAMEALLAKAMPLVDCLWLHEFGAGPLETPEQRAALRQKLVEHAGTIQHRDLAREYEAEFRKRVDSLSERTPRPKRRRGEKVRLPPAPLTRPPGYDPAAAIGTKTTTAVIRGFARHPHLIEQCAELLVRVKPANEAQRAALDLLLDVTAADSRIDVQAIDALFPDDSGYRGFWFGFLKPDTFKPAAEAELRHALSMIVAASSGASIDDLVKAARAFDPPKAPERHSQSARPA
jgi:DNA primase